MNCCQCQEVEELFSKQNVSKELSSYRTKGADTTTRMLTEAIKDAGVQELTLQDIGGGVGAVQHKLLAAGSTRPPMSMHPQLISTLPGWKPNNEEWQIG